MSMPSITNGHPLARRRRVAIALSCLLISLGPAASALGQENTGGATPKAIENPVPRAVASDGSSAQASIGRLFFTPQQRQELDRRRELNIQESNVVVESLYTVNGHISRSSGKTTTWVNGVAQNETYRPKNPAIIPLRPLEDEPSVDLRVGQTLDKNSGTVNKGLAGGEIIVKPGAAPAASRR